MPSKIRKSLGEKIADSAVRVRSIDPELMGADSLRNHDSSDNFSESDDDTSHYVEVG